MNQLAGQRGSSGRHEGKDLGSLLRNFERQRHRGGGDRLGKLGGFGGVGVFGQTEKQQGQPAGLGLEHKLSLLGARGGDNKFILAAGHRPNRTKVHREPWSGKRDAPQGHGAKLCRVRFEDEHHLGGRGAAGRWRHGLLRERLPRRSKGGGKKGGKNNGAAH